MIYFNIENYKNLTLNNLLLNEMLSMDCFICHLCDLHNQLFNYGDKKGALLIELAIDAEIEKFNSFMDRYNKK